MNEAINRKKVSQNTEKDDEDTNQKNDHKVSKIQYELGSSN